MEWAKIRLAIVKIASVVMCLAKTSKYFLRVDDDDDDDDDDGDDDNGDDNDDNDDDDALSNTRVKRRTA